MMKINNIKFKFLIAFICLLGISKAQNNNDFRAWSSFEISSNLTKKFSLSLKTQLLGTVLECELELLKNSK